MKETITILKMLETGKKVQYEDLTNVDLSISTLNERINELLKNCLIEHHLKRTNKKEEWYTLTEKGEKILKYVKEIEELERTTKKPIQHEREFHPQVYEEEV